VARSRRGLGSATATCTGVEQRADREYSRFQSAHADLERARKRLFSVKRATRQIRSQPTVKSSTKARVAVDQADSKVRLASDRVSRAFLAVKKCHRRKAGH
jgi:hypothetical protein